jgi:uridylate kinase
MKGGNLIIFMNKEKQFVIDLGGSAVYPKGGVDTAFLKQFYNFIRKKISAGYKFVIVVGGGQVARDYQEAAGEMMHINDEDKDWIGIHATRLNAHLLRTIFWDDANPVVFKERFKIKEFGKHSLIIGAGWEPGWSTDYVSVQIAADLGVDEVIILGKPDYVYTDDFTKNGNAKPIEKISWADYMKLIPNKWTPGMSVPVDPVAAKLAEKEKVKVIVANAHDLENVGNILEGKEFKGTILE